MQALLLSDSRGRALLPKEKTLYFLITGFFITLFLPNMPVINNIFTGLILVESFFYNSLSDKRRLLKRRKAVQCMLVFYALHMVSAALSVDKQAALDMLVLRLPLLIFPLSIGLLTIRPVLKDRILLCFCSVTTVTALVCLVYAFGQFARFRDTSLLYDDSLTAAIGWQSIYFALVVNLALFSYLYLFLKPGAFIRYKWLGWLSFVFLVVIHFMLASRIAIIILYGGLICFAVVYMIKERRFRMGTAVAVAIVIFLPTMMKIFPKVLNRFRELEYTGYTYNSRGAESHYNMEVTAGQWNGANIRLAVWRCGWELAKQHWVTGAGLGDKQDKLMDIYRAREFEFALRTRRNMHNTYLDVFACFGIVGLMVFLAGWLILPLLVCWRDRDWPGLCILVAFAVSMITETYFDRSLGCMLAGFFICFLEAYSLSFI